MIGNRKNLVLYYGTVSRFTMPSLGINYGRKDFGQGFYCTTDKAQAVSFAKRRARQAKISEGIVNVYEINSLAGLKILEFADADVSWLRFICACRRSGGVRHDYDVVIGKIADDRTALTLQNYMEGAYIYAPQEMVPHQSNLQYVFYSQRC